MALNLASFSRAAALAIILFGLSACKQRDQLIDIFNDQIGHRLGIALVPNVKQIQKPHSAEEVISNDNRDVNAAFIHELFKVVLIRDVHGEDEFAKLMNIMDQGGHFEGIYNGIVHSAEYRVLEKGVAPVASVKVFADVMTQIILDQRYDPLSIAKPETQEGLEVQDSVKPPQPTESEREQLRAQTEQQAITLSFFTLKRKLGEEIIKTIELKREYREKLATWYGRFSVAMNKRGVNFGVSGRNNLSEYEYYKWALDADEDRLRWECINRVHAIMNASQAK